MPIELLVVVFVLFVLAFVIYLVSGEKSLATTPGSLSSWWHVFEVRCSSTKQSRDVTPRGVPG